MILNLNSKLNIQEKQIHWAKTLTEASRKYLRRYLEGRDPSDMETADNALKFLDFLLGRPADEVEILLRPPGDPEKEALMDEFKTGKPRAAAINNLPF